MLYVCDRLSYLGELSAIEGKYSPPQRPMTRYSYSLALQCPFTTMRNVLKKYKFVEHRGKESKMVKC